MASHSKGAFIAAVEQFLFNLNFLDQAVALALELCSSPSGLTKWYFSDLDTK